jgi:hypothetical protein
VCVRVRETVIEQVRRQAVHTRKAPNLEEPPAAVLVGGLDHLLRHGLLALAQGDQAEVARLVLDAVVLAELLRVLDGVHPRREDEEDGRLGQRVVEGARQAEGQAGDVLLAHLLAHKGAERLAHAVRPQAPHDEQLGELVELLPLACVVGNQGEPGEPGDMSE